MIEKLDHIGIAVFDIDKALRFYSDTLGLKCELVEEVAQQSVKIAFIPTGDVNLELVQATSDDSAIAKFIEKKGEGVHHIALKVDNIDDALKRLKEKNIEFIDPIPRKGAHGSKIAFLNPKSTHGVLLELVER